MFRKKSKCPHVWTEWETFTNWVKRSPNGPLEDTGVITMKQRECKICPVVEQVYPK